MIIYSSVFGSFGCSFTTQSKCNNAQQGLDAPLYTRTGRSDLYIGKNLEVVAGCAWSLAHGLSPIRIVANVHRLRRNGYRSKAPPVNNPDSMQEMNSDTYEIRIGPFDTLREQCYKFVFLQFLTSVRNRIPHEKTWM